MVDRDAIRESNYYFPWLLLLSLLMLLLLLSYYYYYSYYHHTTALYDGSYMIIYYIIRYYIILLCIIFYCHYLSFYNRKSMALETVLGIDQYRIPGELVRELSGLNSPEKVDAFA